MAAFSAVFCISFSSCEYDDAEIWERVDDLLARVQKLEAICEQQNSNIAALQTMLNGIKDNVYVTSVTELENKAGYSLEFSNGKKVEIYHGKDGNTPSISIVKEGNNYYWSVNGEILKDAEGNHISANGGDNSSPSLKTGSQLESENVEGTWNKESIYVSVDNVTWIEITTGSSNQIFTSVEMSENGQHVNITLSDGSVISIPKTEKMMELLYGKWESITNGGVWTFTRNMTFTFSDGYYSEGGTFEFLPERYIHIHCTDNTAEDEEWDEVLTIASISETTLYLIGEEAGKFKRVSE